MKERIKTLLLKAADAFEDGSDPFAHHWLAANEVTLDEAIILSTSIAMLIRVNIAVIPRES